MTDGLSRRDMVGLVGAGMVMSACTPRKDSRAKYLADCRKVARMGGGGFYWGENPHDAPPQDAEGQTYGTFDPNYITLLYLGLHANWTVRVNHASYNTGLMLPEKRLEKAIAVFNQVVTNKNSFKDHQTAHPSYKRRLVPYAGHVDSDTFDNFRFYLQTEIFIYLHQADIEDTEQTGISLDRRQLLSFAPRTQARDTNGRRKAAEMNFSFFNAKPAITNNTLLDRVGRMIRVQNWVTNEGGVAIGADQSYSMNIHFTIPGFGMAQFPMVFDPDTGNGQGNEP